MRWAAVLIGWLAAVALAVAAPASAPMLPELGRDWFSASVEVGYSGFVFPVNEPALARDFAQNTRLAWQIAFNHSTIPVRVDINHRRGAAFRGRVEVTTAHGYPVEEDPLGRLITASREFIAPPSVPTSVMLAPRVCPPCQPGLPVRLTVRLFQHGIEQPIFTQQAEAIQLEPAHLYSLHLDAPTEKIESQIINPDNQLDIQSPLTGDPPRPVIAPELFTSRHYFIPIDHSQVTQLPLAANQFVFVMVDFAAVSTWSEEEQLALTEFVLGGGYLCLYNAVGQWQGLNLETGALAIGRGYLLPVIDGSFSAQDAIKHWIEGELAELALWMGGTCQGTKLDLPGSSPWFGRTGALKEVYGVAQHEGEVLARRAGYLHPLMLYRESCRTGALEPWDYPEFLSDSADTIINNTNLRSFSRLREDHSYPNLAEFAAAVRPIQGRLLLIAGLLIIPVLLTGPWLRRQWLWLLLALMGGGSACWLWYTQQTIQEQPVQINVYDIAKSFPGMSVCREIHAVQTGPDGRCNFVLEPDAQIQHLAWDNPGQWDWNIGLEDARWRGSGGGSYVALSTASTIKQPNIPINVVTEYPANGCARVEIDATALANDERCFLLTPLGWQVIPGGRTTTHELWLEPIPVLPGLNRLQKIVNYLNTRTEVLNRDWQSVLSISNSLALAEAVLPDETSEINLGQLALGGLLQQPAEFRGVDWRQCVLIAPLHIDDSQREVEFVRYSFPLEVR